VRLHGLGLGDVHGDVPYAPQLLDRLLGDRLAVPAVLVFDLRVPLALDRLRDDGRWFVGRLRFPVGSVDLLDVVTVDLDRVPTEGAEAFGVGPEIPSVHRFAALAEPVHVDDRRQVVELVEGRMLGRLPHRALSHLAVAADDPDSERKPVEPLAGDGHSHADRQALSERAGCDVDPRQNRRRMPLEPAPELPVGHELLFRERPGGAEEPVDERRGMALREDQPIVRRILRIVVVVPEVGGEQDRGQVRGGHRGGRVAGAGFGTSANRIDPQLLSELPPEVRITHVGVT
jgi:hypothetical protein